LTDEDVRWLTIEEQRSWRSWLSAHTLLRDALDREMKADNGVSLADYEILVRLSECPHRQMRMSDLADSTLSSRSRLSHQVARMEQAGWVERRECVDDRRGTLCRMTDSGWALLVRAAPSHVRSVRRHLVDVLSAEEFAATGASCAKLVEAMQADRTAANLPPAGVPPTPA
jgi:DNA-binding MarR family transcriptional regulator